MTMNAALPIDSRYSQMLLEAHWAVQVPAAASQLLVKQPDFSHTNLLVEGNRLRGRALPDGRRAEIELQTLTLRVGASSLPLPGHTLDEGLAWLSRELGARMARLDLELPARPADRPFVLHSGLAQLQAWFSLAHRLLGELSRTEGGGEVRVWPHHFDIATLIALDDDGGEQARSINVGLSPGDGSYAEPYWYVTPWPRPTGPLPALGVGAWHTEGFLAAVLPASKHDPDELEAQAARFLTEATLACRRLLA